MTETFPAQWVDILIERGANYEVLRPEPNETAKPLPQYITDGRRTIRVKCQAQMSPFSRARLVDFRVVHQVTP